MNEQINSISINNFDDSGNINSEKRIFSNSDLDKTNNEGEIKQTNTINNNSISDDAININNNVNNNINNNVNDNEISEEEKENEKFHKDFIQELKNNKYFGFMISYPLFRLITRPENLLQSKNSIIRKRSSGMHIKEALGLYTKYFECNCRNINLTNIFHIFGSIIWTFPYMILFEVILIFFMIISYIFNKQYYIKFMNCFYNFSFLPV